jgi:hypothetical protein
LADTPNVPRIAAKTLSWGLLGMVIKAGFTGMKGFTAALFEHRILPAAWKQGWLFALCLSTLTNLFFGPQMMYFHRFTDNLVLRQSGYQGLDRALWTLLWFWIPAHTLTFSLPKDFQIGLAALWSVVLGLILGFARAGGGRKGSPGTPSGG